MHESFFEIRERSFSLTPDWRCVRRSETPVTLYGLGVRPRSGEFVGCKARERALGDGGGAVVAVNGN